MATKTINIPELGDVVLAKRRGSRNIRLSITAQGGVRVGLPAWAPYRLGLEFATSRKDWILQQLAGCSQETFKNGARFGKSHSLQLVIDSSKSKASSRVRGTTVIVTSPWRAEHPSTQAKVVAACEKALAKEAKVLLPQRVAALATRHGYTYKQVRIRKLTSRWGSCSSDGTITLNSYLMQLPWHLIDYVILHELTHTKHLNHSSDFWTSLINSLPEAKKLRKEIKTFRPRLETA